MNAEQFTEMSIRELRGGSLEEKGVEINNFFILSSKEKKGNILLLKKKGGGEDERIFLTLGRERSPSQNNISISGPLES